MRLRLFKPHLNVYAGDEDEDDKYVLDFRTYNYFKKINDLEKFSIPFSTTPIHLKVFSSHSLLEDCFRAPIIVQPIEICLPIYFYFLLLTEPIGG